MNREPEKPTVNAAGVGLVVCMGLVCVGVACLFSGDPRFTRNGRPVGGPPARVLGVLLLGAGTAGAVLALVGPFDEKNGRTGARPARPARPPRASRSRADEDAAAEYLGLDGEGRGASSGIEPPPPG